MRLQLMRSRLTLVVITAILSGCATASPPQVEPSAKSIPIENLHAVLWTQTASEFEALCLQTFALARRQLDVALADPSWTATPHVSSETEGPPAIIADVDETLLSNAAYEARLLRTGGRFTAETWKAWVDEANAVSMPGAAEFARYAASRGVTVFYLTNRRADEEAGTRRNLEKFDFPLTAGIDTILTRGERESWGSDKFTRIEHVADGYRVLLLLGDNLDDFLSRVDRSVAERRQMILEHESLWGTHWLMLPNAVYGSWVSALLDHERGLPRDEELRRKFDALDTREKTGGGSP